MSSLKKFFHVSREERYLLICSISALVSMRVALWLLPFRWVHRLVTKMTQNENAFRRADSAAADKVPWAINVASQYVPKATCLTQALAAKILLCRRGRPAILRIGVMRSDNGHFLAHAWIECDGQVVLGGSRVMISSYKSLPPLAGDLL